ncbi:MAG: hypothetical protein OEL76_09390 [Siculibacillus sp.]|nr:hypothetical protein [Siculibacillus sp.]
MSNSIRKRGFAAVSLAVLIAVAVPVTPAAAQQTRDKVLSIIAEASKASGAKDVKWESVSGGDAAFTVTNSETTFEEDGKAASLTAAAVTYTGAKPTADGGFSADSITATDVEFEGDDVSISAASLKITNYVGQSPEKIRAKTTTGERFDRIEAAGLEVTDENDKTVPIASISLTTSDFVAGVPRKVGFEMKSLVVPIDPADEQVKDLAELGYSKLSLDASFGGAWDDKAGRVTIDQLSISGAEAGGLKLSFVLGGITPEVVDALKKAEKDQAKQLEILQGVTVERMSLRYEDASLTKRVIAAQAKKQGIPEQAFVQQLGAIVPMMVTAIGNKDFEAKISAAASAFLKAPKSITVSAKPAKPTPVAEIMGAAMMAPQSLPTVLGADVKAND